MLITTAIYIGVDVAKFAYVEAGYVDSNYVL